MAQEIANGELACYVRIVECERGEEFDHRIVPGDLALVYEHGESGGGERFGIGGDAEECVGVDGCRLAETANAVALGVDYLAILHHRHGDTGNFELLAGALHPGIEIGG